MDDRGGRVERAEGLAPWRLSPIGVRATPQAGARSGSLCRLVARTVTQGRVDALRRRRVQGTLVPDPARIARALLERGLV